MNIYLSGHSDVMGGVILTNDFKIDDLTVYGKFLRRGGIDINPIRSTSKKLIFKNFRDFGQ